MLSSVSLRVRFILLSAVPLTVLIAGMSIIAWLRFQQLRETNTVDELTQLNQVSGNFIHELQLERGISTLLLANHSSTLQEELRQQRAKTDEHYAAYHQAIQSSTVTRIPALAESIRNTEVWLERWQKKRDSIDAGILSSPDITAFYNDLIEELIVDLEHAARAATYDAEILRASLAYVTFIKTKERLGRERALLMELFSRDTATKDEFINATRIASEQFSLASIFRTIATPEQVQRFNDVARNDLGMRIRQMRQILADKFPEGKFSIAPSEWFEITTRQLALAKEYENSLTNDINQHNQALRSRAQIQLWFLLVGVCAVIGLVAFLSALIVQSIRQPIRALAEGAERVEQGDLSHTIPVTSHDEIGRLTVTFNRMIENLKAQRSALQAEKASVEAKVQDAVETVKAQQRLLESSVQEMLQAMEHFAQGNLTSYLQSSSDGEIARLFAGYNEAVDNIRRMVAQVKMVVGATIHSTGEITTNMQQVTDDISTQSQQVSSIATAIESMNSTIAQTTDQTTQASQAALDAEREAQSGGAVVNETLSAVRVIGELVLHAVQSIQALDRSSEQIGMVIQVIDEIADQTNLLALNAAIEAARAGEHGRGFAVVADEVRKLAERTQKATKEISATIQQIQHETQIVVQEMTTGVQEVEKGNNAAAKAKEALERIITRSKEVSMIISQVAAASEEQAQRVKHISASIDSIVRLTQHSQHVVHNTHQTTKNLAELTSDLEFLIGQFRIGDEQSPMSAAYRIGGHTQHSPLMIG
ncbi:MAG: methyl-accepting chemotaxis protein [Bacteroidota bacterium]|nr:methyl-accepting chemotaxis protein [Candidatus Kapabacteria bacterium]MDW8218912.1 methyl-accepting chemotaxis protein [Bacteroidota bacterium]